jgi:hypothetical protein
MAEHICCRNTKFAEPSGYLETVNLFEQLNASGSSLPIPLTFPFAHVWNPAAASSSHIARRECVLRLAVQRAVVHRAARPILP